MVNKSSNLFGKRILITGGTGFIGSFLVEEFYKDNEVTVLDNGRRNAIKFLPTTLQDKIKIVKGDIRDLKIVDRVTDDKDIVIHLAAIAGASFYETDALLTLSVNLFGTANLLQALSSKKIEKIITFSTSEVYGPSAVNVSEDDRTCIGPIIEGRWSYAISKLASDHLARAYFKKNCMPINIIRPFNIYGPRQVGEGAVSNMLTSALKEKRIYVSGNGLQKRAWCFISDLVEAVKLICNSEVYGECFNVGNPDCYVTILELAKRIQELCKDSEIIFTDSREVDVQERVPNIAKSKEMIEFKPKVNLDNGLRLTLEWWKKNIS